MRRALLALLMLQVTVLSAAERVVSLAPSLSEIVLELDSADLLVGVLDGGERPAALAHLPSVGRYGQLEMETLLALQPDLVLLWPGSVSATQREQLQRFGIPLLVLEPHSLHELAHQFVQIGEHLGRAEVGQRLHERFVAGLDELRDRYRRERPVPVFYQVWDAPLYTVGGGQIISDALQVCGARNVFADLHLPAPQVSVEAVLQRDPAVIIAGDIRQLQAWRRWPQLTAVQREQLWGLPNKGLERASFQMLDATAKLCELLAPAR
ncbi:cobalamin-binding protein [Pseudomonas daroniae]|uniref:Cobalamin-binding protein n=1 Tax=Phytopseudomonas daroniae TaxID=2487519 RepID=A0A4Q9QMU2_9GAMM|nr:MULTISPECIES: cobalamin-binding protein [Pseudomonas]TBU81053.1 cobalamin-binding protein [Pseudomonas daroniae]TBU83578.1 cobalamin-binding protein [Pseudomonas sp. FRB 228]TBU87495.1 cobalamin-binding protein [Pseudomonas daroniae]